MDKTKICKTCKIQKTISNFYQRTLENGNIRISGECKECVKIRSKRNHELTKDSEEFKNKRKVYNKEHRQIEKRTKEGWFTKTYSRMKRDNKNKFNLPLPFTKNEFIEWIKNNYSQKFETLFKNYVDSDCDKYLNPSIDRIDDYKSYTFDNMQLITWKENDIKGSNGIKNKVSCAEVGREHCSKTVMQFDTDNNPLKIFSSTHEAERVTGINSSLIAKACRNYIKGGTGYAKGYIWHYREEAN